MFDGIANRISFMTVLNLVKEKDLEVLADAVRRENQRLQAYKSRIR